MVSIRFASAAAGIVLLVSSTATSAADDHLACFKVKAAKVFDAATVDLASALPGFDLAGCTVKSKASQLCVPATKTVVSLEGGTPLVVDGDAQAFQRVCYKVKCPGFVASDVEVTDQFGTQTVTATKVATVCTPAVLGDCVDLDHDTYGAGCSAGEDCDDNDDDVNPAASEICNAVDDDCDGVADDSPSDTGGGCATGLIGVCAAGTTVCSSGSLACQQTTTSSPETCNALDDDCDGVVDDSPSDTGGACATGLVGVCAAGTTVCSSGSLVCQQTTISSPEICNGLDDDCDGVADDSPSGAGSMCATGLGGACAAGTTVCSSGSLVCTPPPGTAEVCNNVDEDCDGVIDDGLTRSCYSGPGGTAGIGRCLAGTQTCAAGFWGATCPGEVIPTTEIPANTIDDDCDGATDE